MASTIHRDQTPFLDSITKDSEGSYLIQCETIMPEVTPKMIDWWFAWHMPESERYKLWHPRDHVSSKLVVDTSSFETDKEKYIGIDSFVTEYIGGELNKLCISFKKPSLFGFDYLQEDKETAVCAKVVDTSRHIEIGSLTHYVKQTDHGSVMQSSFWLGKDSQHQNQILNLLIKPLLRLQTIKSFFLNDRLVCNLYIHCSEEMNHLSKFLPDLYAEMNDL